MKKIFVFLLYFHLSGICFSQISNTKTDSSVEKNDSIYDLGYFAERQADAPSYPGGDQALVSFLIKSLQYPQAARDIRLQGKAYISFIVNKTGEISDAKIFKGVKIPEKINEKTLEGNELKTYQDAAIQMNEEALRVIKLLPKWKPGIRNGKAVNVKYISPINFKLS